MLPKCLLILLLASFIESSRISNAYPVSRYGFSCPHPQIDHGRVRIRTRANRLVKFTCADPYELVGNRYSTCRNGQWDVPMPVCVRPGCVDLPAISNSIQVKTHRDAWVVTFCLPGHKLEGSPVVYCDGRKWNDTAPKCVDDSAVPMLACDFEDPDICGWTQDEYHDFDWRRWNKNTPSYFISTGPSYDHTYGSLKLGYYMYIESSGKRVNATARLLSPIYDYSLAANGCFSFYYHMYGKSIGGLRVYQKPDSVRLNDLLNSQDSMKKYLLFERWGEQGDEWYSAVPQLTPANEDFQIVIEGIRGYSFTSDIAIDDVAILQGDNCSAARLEALKHSPPPVQVTCAGRCNSPSMNSSQCSCQFSCMFSGTCCPDYFDTCNFMPENSTYSDDNDNITTSRENLPETQKLVGETTSKPIQTDAASASTNAKPATTTTAKPSTTTTTAKPSTTTTTTAKPATTMAKPATTKAKPTITTTTTAKPITRATTTAKPATTKIAKKTTTAKPTTTTAKPTTTTAKPTTATTPKNRIVWDVTTSRVLNTTVAPPERNMTVDGSGIEKKKHEAEVNLNKMVPSAPHTQSKSSTWKTAVITIVLLALCVSLIYLVLTARTARGRQVIARLRGRASHDSEVRYLNAADNDEL